MIESPVFFLSFLGAAALIVAALVLEHRAGSRQVVRWVAAALVLCAIVVLVTFAREDVGAQSADWQATTS